ncbi:NeuD/PglB/VioB family sugar acetyltransferase [Bacteroides sp. CG01]|uniref:NeuD/PglB/VioB family sugar acetyltransferase n=1 Tax=Bacteroides sp. CG01 TaxID=3096000 RepID=UPI002AFEB5C7|nr:NeuD/PglB/VioB family sugar acetyltransferase [Bacteroides sp. CG01]
MNREIYVLGVGHNTSVYLDLVEACGYTIKGLYHYNDERVGELDHGYPILGSFDDLFSLNSLEGMNFALSQGDNKIRANIFEKIIEKKGNVPTLIHPSAIVSKYAQVGNGVIIHANSVISPDVVIGDDSVISSNDLITHGSKIRTHCFVASNVVLGANVDMHDFAFIGSGAVVISGKVSSIGRRALIGAGAVVTKNVGANECVAGNPAKFIKTLK